MVVLDIRLPGRDGLDVCRTIRAASTVPIMMFTARVQEEDVVYGLEIGADDYLTKPFSVRELLARVGALARRSSGKPKNLISVRRTRHRGRAARRDHRRRFSRPHAD